MSFKLGGIVLEDLNHGITTYEKLILACYASFALHDGTSIRCAQTTVAKMALCSDRQVRRALEKFESDGVMTPDDPDTSQRKWRRCRINIDRAIELYGGKPKAESSSGTSATNADTVSGNLDGESGNSKKQPDSPSSQQDSQSQNQDSRSGNPGNPGLNPCAPADADAETAPACAHWKASRLAMVERFGESQVGAMLDPLIAHRDDGKKLVLWAPTRFFVDAVERDFRKGLQEVLGREIEVVVKNLAADAAAKRVAQDIQENFKGKHRRSLA